MKRPTFCVIATALLVSCAAAGELVILQPTGKDAVWLMSKRKMDYLSLPLAERVKKFADAGERGILAAELLKPDPEWKGGGEMREEGIF